MAALAGHHAVVTGGGRGIGRAIAAALSGAGARVTVIGRAEAALKETVGLGHAHGYQVADATDATAVRAAFKSATDANGPISILIANAGAAQSAPFAKTSPDVFRQMYEVNTLGVVNTAQAVLPDMIARKSGRIVAIASTAGLKGYAYVSAYCAAKHGVIGLTRALALEVAKKGVTVNAVCPGYTETDILRESIANVVAKTGRSEQEARASFAAGNPQGRIVQPEEVADTVRWLCGNAASAIHGQSISVSGGEVMA